MQRPILQPHNAHRPALRGRGGVKPSLAVVLEDPAPPQEGADEISPLSKFKDWKEVHALAGQPAPSPPQALPCALARGGAAPKAERAAKVAADVAMLVQEVAQLVHGGEGRGAGASLERCLEVLADSAVLALASDAVLSDLLKSLHPLLRRGYDVPSRQWAVPGVAGLLRPLEAACALRLRRSTLPCDEGLASAAARFFARIIRLAGGASVSEELLAAAAAFTFDHARLLDCQALAALHTLLLTARWQPSAPVAFGNRVVERLLRLEDRTKAAKAAVGAGGGASGGLKLRHLSDVVEALSQLRCIDGLSAAPVLHLATSRARSMEEAGQLDIAALNQLTRLARAVAVVAATSTVHSSLLVGASAMWHLLTLRSEALTQQVVSEAASGGSDGSQLAPTLASMWATSHLLMACARMESDTFQLPAHLKLVSHAAWREQEERLACGVTSAQRRVSSKVLVDRVFLDVFHISIEVRMREDGAEERSCAILIRDPLRHLLRNRQSVVLGTEAAQERILQGAGFRVVSLDSLSCLALPRQVLAEELAAMTRGDVERCSLRFAA